MHWEKDKSSMIILQELYTQNYAGSLAQLARISGIITILQVQLRMIGSKYCGILIFKQAMTFNTEDLTQLCCTKLNKKCHLIDIVVPGDKRIELKEQGKIDVYSKLTREVKKIWNLSQVVVVPVVIGALGVAPKKLKD